MKYNDDLKITHKNNNSIVRTPLMEFFGSAHVGAVDGIKCYITCKKICIFLNYISSLQCYSVLSTIAQVLRKMSLKILVS